MSSHFKEANNPKYSTSVRIGNWHEDYLKTCTSSLSEPSGSFTTTCHTDFSCSTNTNQPKRVIKSNQGTFSNARFLVGDLSPQSASSSSSKQTNSNHQIPKVVTEINYEDESDLTCTTHKVSYIPLAKESLVTHHRCTSRGVATREFDQDYLNIKLRK
ncbi:hypothetical protein GEMRC1_001717 [Eukaryota sp. GEM-RC1]